MSEQKCPTCGSEVRVVGKTTMSYEPVNKTTELIERVRFKARDLINIQNYGIDSALGTALDEFVVWADALHSPEASGETEELTL